MRLSYFLLVLLFSSHPVVASAAEQEGYFSLKSVFGDADYVDDGDVAVGIGLNAGFISNGVLLEYDYSQVTEFDLFEGRPVFAFGNQTFNSPRDTDYDIYSHNLFVGYRAGSWAYAEFKVGHSYQRIKQSDNDRVLDEINRTAAGIEFGFASSVAGVGLQHLWLGSDYRQVALALRFYF
ncbi:MAG TPA: hypothetical protein DIW43_05555 [Spongiibacteraceae bacterium]|nr:hypothetical protein [Spongiibacteraceae bacterium]HCS26896.1 hypothetical protein [Spongiibacteraceae bacterium]